MGPSRVCSGQEARHTAGAASSEGFLTLAELLGLDGRKERPLYRFTTTNRSFLPVPDILRTDAHRLVTPVALTDREWEVLAGELRQFLGRDGYLWLASLAIYPALQWDITLYLGATIKGADDLPTRGGPDTASLVARRCKAPDCDHALQNTLRCSGAALGAHSRH